MIELALVAAVAWMALLMPAITWGCAQIGGWAALARQFPDAPLSAATCVRFKDLALGWMNYSGCVTYCVGPEGLRISMLWFFRFGHRPILIPWSALSQIEPPRGVWPFRYARLEIIRGPSVFRAKVPPAVFDLIHGYAAAELQREPSEPR